MTTKTLLRFVVLLTTLGVCFDLTAQSQTRFNYQAQIRDAGDAVLPNAPVDLRVSIRMGTSTGDDVYREVHSDTTSSIGLVNILVGAGTIEVGDIDAVAWGDTTYYLKIDADFGGGYADMGGSPIVSVPIAEYARNGGKPWVDDSSGIHYSEGNVGIGTTATATSALEVKSHVSILGDTLDSERIRLSAASDTRDVHIGAYDETGTRVWNLNMLDRSDDDALGFFSEAAAAHVFKIGTNGQVELRAPGFDRKMGMYANAADDNHITSFSGTTERWRINMLERASNNRFSIRSSEYGGAVLICEPDGRTRVRCLEILGGCDINERFNSTENLEPGTVVVANSDRPGEVCTTDKPYDQRVVGAISGANGIKPGLTLTQEGTTLDGSHPVALDGRVYVKVSGLVEVGDLLTTSNEPGRAMAVKNRKKAFGAVIGKALESDADGDGLVLMLVQPR